MLWYADGKGKVVFVFKHHAMMMYGAVKVKHHAFLTSVLVFGEWSALCCGPLTHTLDRRQVGLQSWSGKMSSPVRYQILVVQPITIYFID
jgi:hypothetical protein